MDKICYSCESFDHINNRCNILLRNRHPKDEACIVYTKDEIIASYFEKEGDEE